MQIGAFVFYYNEILHGSQPPFTSVYNGSHIAVLDQSHDRPHLFVCPAGGAHVCRVSQVVVWQERPGCIWMRFGEGTNHVAVRPDLKPPYWIG